MKIRIAVRAGVLVMLQAGPAMAHGDLDERILQITGELRESPSASLFFRRGQLHLEDGEAVAALQDFRVADRLAPGAFETDPPRAEGLVLLGKYLHALDVLNRCLDRDPSALRCLVIRARVLGRMEKTEAAIRDYRKAVSLVSQPEPDLLVEFSTVLAGNGRFSEALEILDQGLVRLGPLPSLVIPAIEIEMQNGNPGGALRRIERMQAAAPRPEPWMARRASVLARAGHIGESHAAWQSLLTHISALPPGERTSHAMCSRVQEARDALAALESIPQSK